MSISENYEVAQVEYQQKINALRSFNLTPEQREALTKLAKEEFYATLHK